MLSSTSEKKLLSVRAALFAGWVLLAASLVWDPLTPALTEPGSVGSPFRIIEQTHLIQGQEVRREPYAMGNRIFWTMLIPLVPLYLMIAGHEAWRRICPLSFVSQIPRLLGWQRKRAVLNRRSGVVEARIALPQRQSRWRQHAVDIQFGLLFLGLNVRLLFINADRTALLVFFLFVIAAALWVGWMWGGKTWCHMVCPVGVVQKIYTGPGGLLESQPHLDKPAVPQSMCREPAAAGDRSTCVGCTPNCGDVDLERSYWDSLDSPALRRAYYSFLGLILGFYGFYYLYAGNWDYYFSGIWTHEPGTLDKLLAPGLYIGGQALPVPKLVSAPLVLGIAMLCSYALWSALERGYAAASARWKPQRTGLEIRHHMLCACAYVCINTFYFFGGRPNLLLLPTPAVRVLDVLIVALTTMWLLRALSKSPIRYRQESVASGLRRQLQEIPIDFPRALDGRRLADLRPSEIYVLARTLPEFTQVQRNKTYRTLVEDLIRTHRAEAGSGNALLKEMRQTLGITDEEHRLLMLELGLAGGDQAGAHSAVFDNWLRRDNFRVACESLLLGHLQPGMSLSEVAADAQVALTLKPLMEVYQISPDEHEQAMAAITGVTGLLHERALQDLDVLADHARLAFALRAAVPQQGLAQSACEVLLTEQARRLRPHIHGVLAVLAALPAGPGVTALARHLHEVAGDELLPVLSAPPAQRGVRIWRDSLPEALLPVLLGNHRPAWPAVATGITPYRALAGDHKPVPVMLEALIDDGSARSALALWLLAQLAPEAARRHTIPRDGDGDWMGAVRAGLTAASGSELPLAGLADTLRLPGAGALGDLPLDTLESLSSLGAFREFLSHTPQISSS